MDEDNIVDVPLKEARGPLGQIARAAAESGEITRLTDRGKPIAAIVPLEVMEAGRATLQLPHDQEAALKEEQLLLGARIMEMFNDHERETRARRAKQEREYWKEREAENRGDS